MSFLGILVVVIAVGVALLIVGRAVRFFLRLAIVGVFLFILIAGLTAWWYGYWDSGPAPGRNQNRPAAGAPQRRNTNR